MGTLSLRLPSAAIAIAIAACGRSPPAAAPAAGPPGSPAPASAAPAGAVAYANSVASLRREASDAARVPGPGGKDVSNLLTSLHRGEKVTLLELKEDWARVRASDDREGWMKRSAILEGEGITEATVLAPADVFDRPDLLAANARRRIEPGTLVLVVKSRPPFAEVNVSGSQSAWVLAERLATGEKDVSVAKLVEKARWLVRNNRKDDALQILALARTHFAGVGLVEALAAELGEVPAAPEEAAVTPASGELAVPVAPAAPGGDGDDTAPVQ